MSIEKWPEDARLAYCWLEGFCEQRSDLALSKLGQLRRGLEKHYEPKPSHTDLLLLAAADLQSWMKSYGPDGATTDLVQRLRDAALGVAVPQPGQEKNHG